MQCVNAVGQMVADPARLLRAFGDVVDTDEVLQIEPGRYLTFEYIGPTDVLGESPNGPRVSVQRSALVGRRRAPGRTPHDSRMTHQPAVRFLR
ncbi:MAG: hypothetical protein ABI776_08380, partial [Nocardioidaceae bacterium]